MGYEVMLGKNIIGFVKPDNTVEYDTEKIKQTIQEIIAGQQGGTKGGFFTTAKVIYRWDRNRKTNNNEVWNMWKSNPILQSRVSLLNALVFGRGLKWLYDNDTQQIVDRFWRINRLRRKLDAICTDAQLYGEVFIALYPQPSGDVKVTFYESSQVDIDVDAGDIYNVKQYYVTYKDEDAGKDQQIKFMPIETYLNNLEFATPVSSTATKPGKKSIGLNGHANMKGAKAVMVHVKFNNGTNEIYGTSDFKQIIDILPDYMNFIGDRMTIHQLYGSPAYDITIDTEDEQVIIDRINDLAGFSIGSNPVHNKSEEWKPLQFNSAGVSAKEDETVLRGLICAGTGFPEHLLFNQAQNRFDDNTFAVIKIAEDRQSAFMDAFTDIHKFVVAIAGGDPLTVDQGQLIFPEINIMSEKTKAETYVLKVGANICSRRTAAINMGHNWEMEDKQMQTEAPVYGALMQNSDANGAVNGRFTNHLNNQDPTKDNGADDKVQRMGAQNIQTQVMGNRLSNN